jgi:hypothetical protein
VTDIYEKGTCRARAVQGNAVLGFTSGGKEQVGVLMQLLEGPNEGSHITWYGYFTDKSVERTLESLRLLGWQGDDLFDLSTVGDDESSDVHLVIDHETDDKGQTRAKACFINRIAGVAIKDRMNDAQAKAFAQKMRGHVLAQKQKTGSSAPQQPRNGKPPQPSPRRDEAPPHSDGDIY